MTTTIPKRSTQDLLMLLLLLAVTPQALASIEHPKKPPALANPQVQSKPRWLLKDFLGMVESNPSRLIALGDKLFSDERLRITAVEPTLAHEWQHRLAMTSALSELFSPDFNKKNSSIFQLRLKARKILAKALSSDPSLLVRDGAVESLRRIFRMNALEAKTWKLPLEQAFLNEKNILDGEGFFIRETILTAFKEGKLAPSREVIIAAAKDKNQEVRALVKSRVKTLKAGRQRH